LITQTLAGGGGGGVTPIVIGGGSGGGIPVFIGGGIGGAPITPAVTGGGIGGTPAVIGGGIGGAPAVIGGRGALLIGKGTGGATAFVGGGGVAVIAFENGGGGAIFFLIWPCKAAIISSVVYTFLTFGLKTGGSGITALILAPGGNIGAGASIFGGAEILIDLVNGGGGTILILKFFAINSLIIAYVTGGGVGILPLVESAVSSSSSDPSSTLAYGSLTLRGSLIVILILSRSPYSACACFAPQHFTALPILNYFYLCYMIWCE